MWTCIKCSYAYNPVWVENCDICESSRAQATATTPTLITVPKDNPILTGTGFDTNENNSEKSKILTKLLTHGFDEVPAKVPMATFEQDLEDDFQFLPGIFFKISK